jgi:peptidoglycan/LPS O-acetylase OafA/YrhL
MSAAHTSVLREKSGDVGTTPVDVPFAYVPAIDGLRAVAILLVLAAHASPRWAGGIIGVDIFFVISGYLITSILLNEFIRTGGISVQAFYLRRVLRIFPAFLFLLLCYLALIFTVVDPARRADHLQAILYSATYVMNWTRTFDLGSGIIGHTWSLAVEEQFYLIWPLMLTGMLFTGRRNLIYLIGGLVVVTAIWRTAWILPDSKGWAFFGSDARASQLFVGCLLAALPMQVVSSAAAKTWAIPVAVLAVIVTVGPEGPRWFDFAGSLIVAVSAAWLIAAVQSADNTTLSRVLTASVLVGIGRLSYSLYLWHYPIFLALEGRGIVGQQALPFVAVPLSFAAAIFSYYVVEKPFLRLKNRSPHSAALAA